MGGREGGGGARRGAKSNKTLDRDIASPYSGHTRLGECELLVQVVPAGCC